MAVQVSVGRWSLAVVRHERDRLRALRSTQIELRDDITQDDQDFLSVALRKPA